MFGHKRAVRWGRGQYVEVRSLAEILATLDADDKFEGMPFMPEMAAYCGRRARIHRRADRVCLDGESLRGLENTMLLEGLRCDGSAHDGCQRGCLMFWKTAWLKPVPPTAVEGTDTPADPAAVESRLKTTRNGRYYCQVTELLAATTKLARWSIRHLLRDFLTGEATLRQLARVVRRTLWNKLRGRLGRQLRGRNTVSPKGQLGLGPGELVEIKSRDEIEATLTSEGKNRGLSFEAEMVEHCGRRYRVAFPLRKIISQQTGEMIELDGTVVLEGVACQGTCARNCPRNNYFYWREIWLRKVD
jgi:hypothetical protein